MMPRSDFTTALTAVWIIVSVTLFAAAIAPFVLPADVLYSLFPTCNARLQGGSCVLCGMTTAYVHIAEGDLVEAHLANAGALWLWTLSIANFAVAKAYILLKLVFRPRLTASV